MDNGIAAQLNHINAKSKSPGKRRDENSILF
jgi:hypothetical protein